MLASIVAVNHGGFVPYAAAKAAAPIADIPRVLFYGTDDIEPMAGKSGSVAALVRRNGDSLVAEGWRLVEVPGRDHDGCLAAEVILTIALPFVSELCGGACS